MFGGNSQSAFSGLQYWAQGTTSVPNESTQTIAAINYVKTLSDNIILSQTVTKTDTNILTQYTDTLNSGNTTTKSAMDALFTTITNTITNGTTGVTDSIVSNGYDETTDVAYLNTVTLLQNNKRFIQNEVISWINKQIATAAAMTTWYKIGRAHV